MRTLLVAFFACLQIGLAFSQDSTLTDNANFHFFQHRDFAKPWVSEISSTVNKVQLGAGNAILAERDGFSEPFMEIHLGTQIPIFLHEKNDFAFAMAIPVSLHVLWAPFEPETAPIINNDYKFGFSFFGYKKLNSST